MSVRPGDNTPRQHIEFAEACLQIALAVLASQLTEARAERDRETELRRQADRHRADMQAYVQSIPYSNEWESVAPRLVAAEAALEEAREALEAVEWNGSAWIGLETCPACGEERSDSKHLPGCELAAALAAVRARAEAGE